MVVRANQPQRADLVGGQSHDVGGYGVGQRRFVQADFAGHLPAAGQRGRLLYAGAVVAVQQQTFALFFLLQGAQGYIRGIQRQQAVVVGRGGGGVFSFMAL